MRNQRSGIMFIGNMYLIIGSVWTALCQRSSHRSLWSEKRNALMLVVPNMLIFVLIVLITVSEVASTNQQAIFVIGKCFFVYRSFVLPFFEIYFLICCCCWCWVAYAAGGIGMIGGMGVFFKGGVGILLTLRSFKYVFRMFESLLFFSFISSIYPHIIIICISYYIGPIESSNSWGSWAYLWYLRAVQGH